MKILEAIPFMMFLAYIRQIDAHVPENWEMPFVTGGLAGMVIIVLFFYKKMVFDRLFLGINLYLISGGLAVITHQWWLNRMYDQLQASGVLLWIVGTGMVSVFFSQRGFIGGTSPYAGTIKKYSCYLLLASGLAVAVSFLGRGNRLLSEVFPFAGLFILQHILKHKLGDKKVQNNPGLDSG